MRRTVTALSILLLAGCTVQVGRDPENTFEVDTDLTPEEPPPEAADGASPATAEAVRPDEVDQNTLQRNWRIGAENTAPDRTDPVKHYTDLYQLFRSDHAEASRLAEQGHRGRAQLFANRAARRLGEMKPLLDPAEQAPLEALRERYQAYADSLPETEGTLARGQGHSLASEIAARFSPGTAKLAPAAEISAD